MIDFFVDIFHSLPSLRLLFIDIRYDSTFQVDLKLSFRFIVLVQLYLKSLCGIAYHAVLHIFSVKISSTNLQHCYSNWNGCTPNTQQIQLLK